MLFPELNTSHKPSSLWDLGGLALFALALLIFWWTVLALDPAETRQRSLAPYPDGVEYVDGAVNIVAGKGFGIHVGGEFHPSRYPFAFSYLLAARLALGGDPMRAPYQVNKVAGLALLLSLSWLIFKHDKFGAGLAALLTATLPAFIILCRSPMAEIVSTLLLLWSVVALYRFASGKSWMLGAAGALGLSLAVTFRFSNVLFATLLLLAVAYRLKKKDRKLANLVPLPFFALGLLPLLIYNWVVFESPWRTGYDYWLQRGLFPTFLHYYVPIQFNYYLDEFLQREKIATVAGLFGEGSYYGPAFIILIIITWMIPPISRLRKLFSVAGLLYLLAILFYYFPDGRLVFPLVLAGIPVAAMRLSAWIREAGPGGRTLATLALLLAAVGYPGHRSDTDIGDMWKTRQLSTPIPTYDLALELKGRWDGGELLILSDQPSPFFHALLGDPVIVAPLLNEHNFHWNPKSFFFGDTERAILMRRFLDRGDPIVVIAENPTFTNLSELCKDLDSEDCQWREVKRSSWAYLAVLDPAGKRLWPVPG